MSASDNVLCDIQGRVALVTINRPDKRNALDSATRARLIEVFDALAADAEVRAVVLTGAGDRAFSAGFDLEALDRPDLAEPAFRALIDAVSASSVRAARNSWRARDSPHSAANRASPRSE